MKKIYKYGCLVILSVAMISCQRQSHEAKEIVSATNSDGTLVLINELDEDTELMKKSDASSNGDMFDCIWRADNVRFSDGIMSLVIDLDGIDHHPRYSGGEYRTQQFYQYGLYEVEMKPIQHDGVVSSFFIYTGPSDGNAWDEIDIEFLGKDTTKVQFNYISDGKGNHESICDLGFDASKEFHEYGFEWTKDCITWYVDHQAVHTADKDIPNTPARIMMNVWPGTGVDEWLSAYDGNTPLTAQYDWFQYTEYKDE